jgi:hypothetical protein
MRQAKPFTILVLLLFSINMIVLQPAMAWGDEGHKVIALIAQALLNPIAKQRVNALLDADSDSLTAHDIASEATWADKYREANIDGSRDRTRQWHFVDIEIDLPDVDQACFNHPPSSCPTSSFRRGSARLRYR